jgi:hypothetical protein
MDHGRSLRAPQTPLHNAQPPVIGGTQIHAQSDRSPFSGFVSAVVARIPAAIVFICSPHLFGLAPCPQALFHHDLLLR